MLQVIPSMVPSTMTQSHKCWLDEEFVFLLQQRRCRFSSFSFFFSPDIIKCRLSSFPVSKSSIILAITADTKLLPFSFCFVVRRRYNQCHVISVNTVCILLESSLCTRNLNVVIKRYRKLHFTCRSGVEFKIFNSYFWLRSIYNI